MRMRSNPAEFCSAVIGRGWEEEMSPFDCVVGIAGSACGLLVDGPLVICAHSASTSMVTGPLEVSARRSAFLSGVSK